MIDKTKKLDIFDFFKSVTYSKEDLSKHENFNKYSQFMMNKLLYLTNDVLCITIAMYLSEKDMDKLSHYKFLFYELPQGYRKINKSVNNTKEEELEIIKEYYNISNEKAKELLRLLTDTQIEKMINGGRNELRSKNRTD